MLKVNVRGSDPLWIDEKTVLTFPDGFPGFESDNRYKLFHEDASADDEADSDDESSGILWLQSLDNEQLVFSVVNATSFGISYQIALSDDEVKLLEIDTSPDEEIAVLMMLSKEAVGKPQSTIKPHLISPIFINMRLRVGLQKTLKNVTYSIGVHGD